jgi:hypothetical protein
MVSFTFVIFALPLSGKAPELSTGNSSWRGVAVRESGEVLLN